MLEGLITILALLSSPEACIVTPEEHEVVRMVNESRVEQGLEPLKISPELMEAADKKAKDMIKKGYFAHVSPEGKRFSEFVKGYSVVGENLARTFKSFEGQHEAWLESDSHRKIMLKESFTETGVSVITVQFFGK